MANARLIHTVCTVAVLIAAPAFAQTDTSPASTGAGSTMKVPAADGTPATTTPGTGGTASTQSSTMTPAANMGSPSGTSSPAAVDGQSMHAMAPHSSGMMHAKGDSSQNAAVDRLNDESYQAAQQGRALSASNMGSGGMTAPDGSTSGASSAPGGTTGTDVK
jgi:hypothetical protein